VLLKGIEFIVQTGLYLPFLASRAARLQQDGTEVELKSQGPNGSVIYHSIKLMILRIRNFTGKIRPNTLEDGTSQIASGATESVPFETQRDSRMTLPNMCTEIFVKTAGRHHDASNNRRAKVLQIQMSPFCLYNKSLPGRGFGELHVQ
jgi:hypothetical protein